MEIEDVLKLQNRYLDSVWQSPQIKELKQFNEELIEKIEFEKKYPLVFSERVVRLLVKLGFYYFGHSTGKNFRSYEHYKPSCRIRWGDCRLIYFDVWDKVNGGWENILIPKEEMITEEYLKELLKQAA